MRNSSASRIKAFFRPDVCTVQFDTLVCSRSFIICISGTKNRMQTLSVLYGIRIKHAHKEVKDLRISSSRIQRLVDVVVVVVVVVVCSTGYDTR